MRLELVKADPTGNATVLVLSPVPEKDRPSAAAALMALDGGWAEQVGFVSQSENAAARLDMMGGEFCGNASLSLAAYLAEKRALTKARVPLSVSGAPETVACEVSRDGALWRGTVAMPLPLAVSEETFAPGGLRLSAVRFPGITHVVVPAGTLTRAGAESVIATWDAGMKSAALGILLFDEAARAMEPLVFVAATRSAVWERGCASGTAAIGAYLASKLGGTVSADISQPGGTIGVSAVFGENGVSELRITGGVRIIGEAAAEI